MSKHEDSKNCRRLLLSSTGDVCSPYWKSNFWRSWRDPQNSNCHTQASFQLETACSVRRSRASDYRGKRIETELPVYPRLNPKSQTQHNPTPGKDLTYDLRGETRKNRSASNPRKAASAHLRQHNLNHDLIERNYKC